MPELFDNLLAALVGLPPLVVYWALGGLAALENVFPPVPADTAVAVGAFLSRRGAVTASAVFGVTVIANVGSAVAVYVAGRTLGRQFFTGRLGTRLLRPAHLRRIERLYGHFGGWGIVLSRFIPGVRAVVPPFAGIARVPAWTAVVAMATASAIWYGALTFAVATFADRIEDAIRFVANANRIALAVGVAVLGWVVFRYVHHRSRRVIQ